VKAAPRPAEAPVTNAVFLVRSTAATITLLRYGEHPVLTAARQPADRPIGRQNILAIKSLVLRLREVISGYSIREFVTIDLAGET
jgi:hypothetical protein